MIIYPAIDVKGGEVVRLRQGDPTAPTVYSQNPLEVAKRWRDLGASHLHLVNLDGALDQTARLWSITEAIAQLGLNLQFGGGLRDAEDVRMALRSGVSRAVLGTLAAEQPDLVSELVLEHGAEKIVVALDARQGKVATHGWQNATDWTPTDLGREMAKRGVRHALYTDILRDGQLEGVNIPATQELARQTGLQVIASGGVRSLDDIRGLQGGDVAGVILGKSLYEGLIDLAEALAL